MSDKPEPDEAAAAAFVDAASALEGLPIAPAYRPGVIRNIMLLTRMAGLVLEHELGPADEPAPVFRASEDRP